MAASSSSSSALFRSRHYFQGGYDYDFVDDVARFECPICLLCQRDPHQTSCGHRFCYSCILTWLNEGRTCPKDNSSLGEGDIFADAMAHREILQLSVRCPFKNKGCEAEVHLADADSHAKSCTFAAKSDKKTSKAAGGNSQTCCESCGEVLDDEAKSSSSTLQTSHNSHLICPNELVACPYASAGCSDRVPRKDLAHHVQSQTQRHLQIINERLSKMVQMQSTVAVINDVVTVAQDDDIAPSGSSHLTRTYSGSALQSTQKFIKELFQRVVQLEQKHCQMEIEQQRMIKAMEELKLLNESRLTSDLGRFCHGNFVWSIKDFPTFHEQMRQSHSFVIYSHGFYTSPFGHRFCLRCNVTFGKDNVEHLALFVHVMKGENDDHLRWPFRGTFTLTMINHRRQEDDVTDKLDATTAQHTMERVIGGADRNKFGFGFTEFYRINGLFSAGFVSPPPEETLVFKVQVHEMDDDDAAKLLELEHNF